MPKRAYTLEELRLNKIQAEQFLAPQDTTLSGVRNVAQGGYLAALAAAYFAGLADLTQIVQVCVPRVNEGVLRASCCQAMPAGGGQPAVVLVGHECKAGGAALLLSCTLPEPDQGRRVPRPPPAPPRSVRHAPAHAPLPSHPQRSAPTTRSLVTTQVAVLTAFLLTVDQVANAGGLEALVVDSAGRVLSGTYARRVALHEAGHFLVAYLLGLLPRGYALSSLDLFLTCAQRAAAGRCLRRRGGAAPGLGGRPASRGAGSSSAGCGACLHAAAHQTRPLSPAPPRRRPCRSKRQLNVQAGCQFCDSAFQAEVASGRLTSGSLDTYACVALAGVATEWLRFGRAEGGLADVLQLDRLLAALSFTQVRRLVGA